MGERDASGGTQADAVARVAANLRRLRATRGWTQEQAAERCGDLATQYLQLIEGEGVNPTLATLVRLADGFGVDVAELLSPIAPLPPRRVGRPPKRRDG